MLKTQTKKITAFMSMVTMLFSMLLYFPDGIFSIDFGLKASAATVELLKPDGDGTSDNPYTIGTKEELYWFAGLVNGDSSVCIDGVTQNKSACAKLTDNIIVNKELVGSDKITDDTEHIYIWTPIGNISNNYGGTFDGQNHKISGLYFNDPNTGGVGLFGDVESGTIKNVGVEDSYFNGNNCVGGVCGYNTGTITNCYNKGNVSGSKYVGGVCGCNTGTITNCYNTGNVSGTDIYVGGVCGRTDVTITSCHNEGNVSGTNGVGGICGCSASTIKNCYNKGPVSGSEDVGGVCGVIVIGTITDCDNEGTVSGSTDVGGVCGENMRTITDCDNKGTVSGSDKVGGICGDNLRTITDCDNEGTVSGLTDVGGVCGKNDGTITNCTNKGNVTVTGNNDDVGGVCGLNSGTIKECSLLKSEINITDLNLSESLTINAGGITGKNVKGIVEKCKSNELTFNLPESLSDGSSGGLKKLNLGGVSGNNDSGNISNCTNYKSIFKLDDNLHNLNVTAGGVCGLNTNSGKLSFCSNSEALEVLKRAIIPPLSLNTSTAMLFSSATTYLSGEGETGELVIGGVVGTNENSTVENSYNTGKVSTEVENATVGGVTGQNSSNGTTRSCYNTGAISATGTGSVGSVCGVNGENSTVAHCFYSNASISGIGSGLGSAESKNTNEIQNADFCETVGYHSPQASNDFKCINCQQYEPAVKNIKGEYEISNASQLYWFADKVNNDNDAYGNANAVLTDNITVNSNVLNENGELNTTNSGNFTSWTPIGNNSNKYAGTFDGKGFTVSGLYFNDTEYDTGKYVGLFGYVGSGSVSNVGVVDSYFKGKSYVGGVCGWNYGTIENCYNTGNVSGSDSIGGVCGRNYEGTITNCYNTDKVSGSDSIGGVCGYNDSFMGTATITNCYNTGAVIGVNYVGGVCGWNYVRNGGAATITNCYNTGNVTGTGSNVGGVCGWNEGTITNCYYNSTVYSGGEPVGVNNGGTVGDNVLGKPTAQFNKGEVAYLLQGSQTVAVWGQQIGTDNYPVLGGAKVYQNVSYVQCEGNPTNPTYSYENEQKSAVYQEHSYVEGYCKWCDKPEHQHAAARYARTNVVESTCTEYGSYTRLTYCSCGQLMSTRYFLTLPKEHDYSSGGICKTCSTLKNGKDGFKSASLTLTDGVIINYNLLLSDEALADTKAYIHFTSPQGLDVKTMLSEGVEDSGKYKFSLKLRPDQMADIVTAKVVYSDGSEGNSVDYSVQKYADNQSSTADTKTSDLINAMLYYGAATQNYTGNNTDNPANGNVDTIFDSNVQISDDYKMSLNGTVNGIKIKGASLIAGSLTTIRVKYQVTAGSISDFTFTCDGVQLTPVKEGNYYYVYISDISPDNIDKMYSIVVTDKSGNSRTLKYSALTYAKSVIEDTTGKYPESLVNMMKALYYYNKAADAFSK